MKFVFDLDDTLCDTDAYSEFYISQFIKANNLPYLKISDTARFAEDKFSWDKETAIKWYKEFGDAMFPLFPIKTGVKELMNYLHANGHIIVIATARDTNWHADPFWGTIEWLTKNEIPYDKLYIGRNDKEAICEEENADVFIDDDVVLVARVAEYFSKKGSGCSFLSTTNYNQNLEVPVGVTRVKGMQDFYEKCFNCECKL